MQHGVREFVGVYVVVQEAFRGVSERSPREKIVHRRSPRRIAREHLADRVAEGLSVPRGDGRVHPAKDLDDEKFEAGAVKGMPLRAQLVQDAPEAPHVGLVIVGLILANLWGEVVGRADGGGGELVGSSEHFAHAEIAKLAPSVGGEKDVLRLEVAVEHLAIVDVLQPEKYLGEPVHDRGLGEGSTSLRLDSLVQVAAGAVVLHDAQLAALGEGLETGDDVGVMQRAQELRLLEARIALLLGHLGDVHLFLRRRWRGGIGR